MPQLNSGGGDDLGANDEMISFKDEGEQDEKIQENAFTERDLADLKSSLVNESEINQNPNSVADPGAIRRVQQDEHRVYTEKHREHLEDVSKRQDGGMYKAPAYSGYPFLMLPDPYLPNGTMSPSIKGFIKFKCPLRDVQTAAVMSSEALGDAHCRFPEHMKSNKVSVVQQPHGVHPLTPLLPYSNDHFNPSSPHLPTDMSQKPGVHRPPSQEISGFYSLPPAGVGQITPSMSCSPPKQSQPVYPISSCGFRQPYSSSLPTSSSFSRCFLVFSRFPHSLVLGPSSMHPTGIPHPAIVPPTGKQEHDQYDRNIQFLNDKKPQQEPKRDKEPKKPVIKKPLNAFMLYMKEMRAKVIAECTLKESAAINQILGRRWHALSREEQAKYYELARKERQLHMQLYPSWSARDNYGKKKRRKREKQQDSSSAKHNSYTSLPSLSHAHVVLCSDPGSPKKCRARFGLNQQTDWCGPCRRKKKCIRYLQGERRCASPDSSDGSAIDSPPSPPDVPPAP
uniref:Transcription factor 7 n=1 Tax=Lepisosteus oculatus TaxID=7918 RepID=W5MVZ9_LEPOC